MKKFKTGLKTKQLLVILIVVCIALLALTSTEIISIAPVRNAASVVIVPFQKGINNVGKALRSLTSGLADTAALAEENAELKERIAFLEEENTELTLGQDELERLRALYETNNEYSQYDTIAASVISRGSGIGVSSYIIDKGSSDGIEENMNVISGGGLAGIITEVGPHYAVIRSILDDSSNVSAATVTTNDTCIVSGDLTLANEGLLSFSQMNTENQILPGEKVVTSNISDKFLKGITIGTISEISNDSNNLTKTGTIIPAVDFNDLQEVLVILKTKDVPEGSVTEG